MDKKYEEIYFDAGRDLESAVNWLLEYKEKGKLVVGSFNGCELHSDTVTMDSAYKAVTGKTKKEHEEYLADISNGYRRQEQEHIDSIPDKIILWKEKGREVLDESKWEYWDEIVPIRLADLYQGMELEACLDIVKILNTGTLEEAKTEIEDQNHSGMSFNLVSAMVGEFSLRGKEFVEFVNKELK